MTWQRYILNLRNSLLLEEYFIRKRIFCHGSFKLLRNEGCCKIMDCIDTKFYYTVNILDLVCANTVKF